MRGGPLSVHYSQSVKRAEATALVTRRSSVWVLRPATPWSALGVRELWDSRDLLYFLARRDVKLRYTQAAIGAAWAVVQPLLMMGVFSLVLGRLARVSSNGIPYEVFVFAGLVPWTFFSNAVASSSESVVSNSSLVSKVYFHRLVIPLAAVIAWLPDVIVASFLLGILMAVFQVVPTWAVVTLPAFILLGVMAAVGVGTWAAALNVAYRDVRYAIPFLLQLGLFATPVVYPATLVPVRFRWVAGLNPMAGVVEGFRWAVTGVGAFPTTLVLMALGVATVLLVSGLYYFRRVESFFADVI